MLAILVAFGAALVIWFHHDVPPTEVESACYLSEPVEVATPAVADFTRDVFGVTD